MLSLMKSRQPGKTLFFIFIACFLSSFLSATIINVPADYGTIQLGINAAANGDTVLVQPGTYVENINYFGKLITVSSLYLTTRDTTYISSTIIDGNSSSRVVTFFNSEDFNAVLYGFTITNGSATNGGGISCFESSPSLQNVIISGNSATNGGGVYCYSSSPSLQNVTISGNSADDGGGIFCYWYSSPSLQNVTITGNSADDGGGINCGLYSIPSLQNVTISGNSATSGGGGIYSYDSSPSLENVTIFGNSAVNNGGGIYCNNSYPSLINSILWNDSPQEIYITSGSVTATYSDIQGGWTGTGNIDSDPLFADSANGDYHLQPTSPCIDAGDPASLLDPDGTIVDMGAYYFHQHFGPVWYISTTGSDLTGNGSEQFPFATIQLGINFSAGADTVLVKPGTYVENINFNGKLITLGSLFLTTQDTTHISSTIIDGDSTESVVTFDNGEDSTAVLCGFTITNGLGGGTLPDYYGGGITCKNLSNPILENLIIKSNYSVRGAGICCGGSSPILQNMIIIGNSSEYGGGIYCYIDANPILQNVTISGNTASTGCGGGICCYESDPSLINSILWNYSYFEIYISTGSVTATYSDIRGGYVGTGNIDSDPRFVDPANGDYHLQPTSPCIDTGDPASPLDPDGTIADMGAYYSNISNRVPTITAVTDVPDDQGRYVQVIWNRSPCDVPGSPVTIESYSVWRYDDISGDRGLSEIYEDPREIFGKAAKDNDKNYYWQRDDEVLTFITQIPAMGFAQYSIIAPTLKDSIVVSINYSAFKVVAHTDVTLIYYPSLPDSGYSIDNIAPDETRVYITQNGSNIDLNWDEVEYGTFQGNSYPEINGIWYKIYAGDTPDFICDEAHLLDTVTNLNYDYPLAGEEKKFFKIVVSDQPEVGRSINRFSRPEKPAGGFRKVK